MNPCSTPLVTNLPIWHINNYFLSPAIQPVFCSSSSPSTQTNNQIWIQEYCWRQSWQPYKVNETHLLFPHLKLQPSYVEGNQACHAWFPFDKSMPIVPNHFLLLVPRNAFQEHQWPIFPGTTRKLASSVATWTVFWPFLKGAMYAFLQSSGSSPDIEYVSKMMGKDLTVTLASSSNISAHFAPSSYMIWVLLIIES